MKKVLLWILGIAVTLIVIGGGVAALALHNTTSKIHSMDSSLSKASDTKTSAGKPVSYLLLGTDTGALGRTEKGRTDTMMVMSVNPNTKTTTMVSLQRDTKITIDGMTEKLNAAYALGDAKQAMTTVEQLLDIKLDGYLLVNMKGLEQLVDAVGGVTVKSPLTFSYEGYSFTENQDVTMNGTEALAFSRMRYDDPRGDYGRQIRQQLVIEAVMNKLKADPKSALNNAFLDAVSDNVRSNISLTSIRNLATKYRDAGETINHDQMTGTGVMIDGVSYQEISQDEITRVHKEIVNAEK
ncbi:LCP family glycopolymer transferase [Weissella confusa]|uniref:LCP family glycopolymer transferase n=1 Tax=Weissella confusa TaxID=1583 RepID=UPI00223A72F2|nr:LCP family protein [Weissella confusa]MCT0006671.1 LytR family transcriptional regulator [Weissella confusa]MCT0019686.1 LytR family transcriptional regulator [Weissella confusa]MCT0039732.1 LytR family transcriptional regulator [Weissella confusa]